MAGCRKEVKAKAGGPFVVPVTVARVEKVPLDQTLAVVGTLYAKDDATISAEVEGQVEKTLVDFGDRVKEGQDLALINTSTYTAYAMQAAASFAKAQANADNAEHELKRIRELQKNNIASEADLDRAVSEAAQKRAEIKSAEADEAIARLHLEKSHVKAPFDAAISERIASAGDYLKTGAPLFRVVNDHVLKYIVQAPERYAGMIQKDQVVTFTVDAFPEETFTGRVYLISPSVNTTTRAFAFGALVQNPEGKLKASTFARGQLVLKKGVPTSIVPIDAVQAFAGVTKVFLFEGGVVRTRTVQPGRIFEGRQEIVGGLTGGETVVTSGFTKLYDGAPVRLRDVDAKK